MPQIFHIDKEGFSHYGYQYHGLKLPLFDNIEEILSALPYMPIRDEDVLLIGYPKSGTHWLWEVINMILHGNTTYMNENKVKFFIEYSKQEAFETTETPRVLNSHLPLRLLPLGVLEKNIKTVFVARNPKDIAVSLYWHMFQMYEFSGYEGTFNGFFDVFLDGHVSYGSWFDYMLRWQEDFDNNPDWPVHTILYEDMKEEPVVEIQKLASFLGKNDETDFCAQVADKCSIEKMRKVKPPPILKMRTPGATLFRKGVVGDWKNFFTVAQNEKFDELYQEKTKNLKLKFRFEL